MIGQTFVGFNPEEDVKLQQLINLTKKYDPSQIVELGDDRILVTIPWRSPIVQDSDAGSYKFIEHVEPKYVQQAITLTKIFEPAIDKNLRFDLDKAVAIAKEDKTLQITGKLNARVEKEEDSVSAIVTDVIVLLHETFKAVFDEALYLSLIAVLVNAFTNLETQESSAWIYWHITTANSTTYYYGIMFAVQNAQTGDFMLVVPVGFEITVNKAKVEVLGITLVDTAEYAVGVKAIRVAQLLDKQSA